MQMQLVPRLLALILVAAWSAPFLPLVHAAGALRAPAPSRAGSYYGHHHRRHGSGTCSVDPGADDGGRGLFPVLTWLRDLAVELLFGRPPSRSARSSDLCSSLGGLRGRYADHIVVRFNVSAPDEEAALAGAADRLFLDVWAVTPDFVDVRIRKDYVGPLLKLLPLSLRTSYSVLISDLAAAAWATYPTSRAGRDAFGQGSGASEPVPLRQYPDSVDNVFFRDYQPLPVGLPPLHAPFICVSLGPAYAPLTRS